MYDLNALINIYSSEVKLPHYQVRELLLSGHIHWGDLIGAVNTFALKCQSTKALDQYINPQKHKEISNKRNQVNLLIEMKKNSKSEEERNDIAKQIDKIQFKGETREELVARSNRIRQECEDREKKNELNIEAKRLI